jgi:FAD synthetase
VSRGRARPALQGAAAPKLPSAASLLLQQMAAARALVVAAASLAAAFGIVMVVRRRWQVQARAQQQLKQQQPQQQTAPQPQPPSPPPPQQQQQEQQVPPRITLAVPASDDLSTALDALISGLAPAPAAEVAEALEVLRRCFERYAFDEVALSFNGGKDCTVVLHLLRAVLPRVFPGRPGRGIGSLRFAYFAKDDDFPEMHEFMEEMRARYGFRVDRYSGDYKQGLRQLEQEGVKAVLMGQRKTDPYGAHLQHFSPCSTGWPEIMRVNPILGWSYATVWAFLRGLGLEYCRLYDEGYTSLGSKHTTQRNPALVVAAPDGKLSPRPAHELQDGDLLERASRST